MNDSKASKTGKEVFIGMNYKKILKYIYPIIVIIVGFVLSYISTLHWTNMAYKGAIYICVVVLLIVGGKMIYKKSD